MREALASIAICAAALLGACATPQQPPRQAGDAPYRYCESNGFKAGTQSFEQCWEEVDKAMWRRARSARAHLACTPMGDTMVCQ